MRRRARRQRGLRELVRPQWANRCRWSERPRPAVALRYARALSPARGVQPRLTVVRSALLGASGHDGGVRCGRRDDDARGHPGGRSADSLLPGVFERDLRRPARVPSDGGHAARAADAVRRCQSVRALHHRQLPQALRAPRLVGDSLQPRVATPPGRLRHTEGDVGSSGDLAGLEETAGPRQSRRRTRLELCRRRSTGDVADAATGHAGRLRDRERRASHGP